MGLFGNLFKEQVKWNENELKALLAVLTCQAGIDGNVDDDEAKIIDSCMANLPGFKPSDWKEFTVSATKISSEIHLKTLRNMHSDKRKILVATVALVGVADGHMDHQEGEFFTNLDKLMNVTFD